MQQRSSTELPRCAVSYTSEDGVDKTLVLASAFALAPHQRHTRLQHCIITMPSGQWERVCCNLKRKLSFVEFYPKQTKQAGGEEEEEEKEEGVSGRPLRQGQLIERGKIRLPLLATCEQVNGSEVCNELISIWMGREGERGRDTQNDILMDFQLPFFSLAPFCGAFIYLSTSFLDAVNSIHSSANGQVILHQQQGRPRCDIWWLRATVDDVSEGIFLF